MKTIFRTITNVPIKDLQIPSEVSVVIPSILRPSIKRSIKSIINQSEEIKIQILIGVDLPKITEENKKIIHYLSKLKKIIGYRCSIIILWPGYSTSERHGGLGKAKDGGVMRSVLSQLANSPRVAYLDDDNWWAPNHLKDLLAAIDGHDWAWSRRNYVDPETQKAICEDAWESVGPGQGHFLDEFGGFVDPNCLMIDKQRVPEVLHLWNKPLDNDDSQMTADRTIFNFMKSRPGRYSGSASTYYVIRLSDSMHTHRSKWIGKR